MKKLQPPPPYVPPDGKFRVPIIIQQDNKKDRPITLDMHPDVYDLFHSSKVNTNYFPPNAYIIEYTSRGQRKAKWVTFAEYNRTARYKAAKIIATF